MTNEFDRSERPQYVSNYIPLPFQELNAMAATQQKQYDTAVDETYKLNDLVNSIPTINDPNLGLSNIDIKKTIDNKYASRVHDISNKIVNGGDLNALRDLNNLKREIANDPNVIEAKNSALNYKTYVEDKAKKGDKYAQYKDSYRDQPLIDENGNLKPFRYSGMGDMQDHSEEARKQMAGVKDWGYDTKNSHLEADGNIYTKDSHGKYIKDSRIRGLADEKAKDFITTEEGKDFLDLIKYENPNATPQQLHKRVSDYLFNAGSNQIFQNFGGGTDVQVTGLALARDKEKQPAQLASTTPEILNLKDNGELSTVMPKDLSKFYSGDKLSLTNDLNPGNKEAGDRIANTGGWLNLEMSPSDKSNSTKKNAIEYINQLFENAAKILGTSKKDVANIYKGQKDGYSWLKSTVEDYYTNLTLQKNTVATLQGAEQATATSFFLGDNVSKDASSSAIGQNIRGSKITDLNGKEVLNKEGINSNNFTISSIGFDKPGQVVLSGNDGTQLLMDTNYETFKKITKPVVDIVKNSNEFKKTFELTDDQKSRLGSKKPLESKLNIDGSTINKTQFDKQQFNIGNTVYSIDSYLIRENNGQPVEYHYIKEQNQETGEMSENTLTADQLKVKFSNAFINSPEFRGLNKQKENKVSFDNQ